MERSMNKKGKEKMEDAASGSFSMNKHIFDPETSEAALSLFKVKEAAWNLVHLKQECMEPETAIHLQMLIEMDCVPLKIQASFPKESLPHLVGKFSSCLQKELTSSDVKQNQMRLMFPKSFVEKDINPLLKDGESPKCGIPTTLYFVNPKTKQEGFFPIIYKSWGLDKTHVLTAGWFAFVEKCNIKAGDIIRLWAFRHSKLKDLRFAVTLRLPDEDRLNTETSGC